MARLDLRDVTLVAASSVNIAATIAAMRRCLDHATFGDAILFADGALGDPGRGLRHVEIAPLRNAADYSHFMIRRLGDHVATSHCLIVQWDGFILAPEAWDPAFLDFDYIGAVWPQFSVDRVGNGGFSLRSRRLLRALADPAFPDDHPEDLAICRTGRAWLEARHAIRFADPATAARFSYERLREADRSFGFHGVFNLPGAIGADGFWRTYRTLDHRGPVFHDVWLLCGLLMRRPRHWIRAVRLLLDFVRAKVPLTRRSASPATSGKDSG